MQWWPRTALALLGIWGMAACAARVAWEPTRLEKMTSAAEQARARGNPEEAERLCLEALRYVDTSAASSLHEYALLLEALERGGAVDARPRADTLRRAETGGPGSTYLGWRPSGVLEAYADLLSELKRDAEAESIRALAGAYDRAQRVHFLRLLDQHVGGDLRGRC